MKASQMSCTLRVAFALACVGLSAACGGGFVDTGTRARCEDFSKQQGGCAEATAGALRVYTNDGQKEGGPDVVLDGRGARISLWRTTDTKLVEVRFVSRDGTASVRTLIDRTTGEPRLIIDELTGHQTAFVLDETAPQPSRMAVTYDAAGRFVEGWVLFEREGVSHLGRLVSRPPFEGQLAGQLESRNSGQTGSFAVVSDATRHHLGASELLDTSAGPIRVSGVRPVPAGALAVGAQLIVPRDDAFEGALSLPSVLQAGGVLLLGVAVVAEAPVFLAAGVAVGMASLFSNDIATVIERRFSTDAPVAGPAVQLLVDSLRNGSGGFFTRLEDLAHKLENGVDWAKERLSSTVTTGGLEQMSGDPQTSSGWSDIVDGVRDFVDNAGQTATQLLDTVLDSLPTLGDTKVSGQAVFQDGSTYDLTGTVGPDGEVRLTGTHEDGSGLTINGTQDGQTFTGGYTREDDSGSAVDDGTAEGEARDIGTCEETQGSGGQGTFTNAHFVGNGPGEVSFFYDAYSIPDAFTVRGPGVDFDTGGLVSGSATVPFAVSQSGSVVLFVSVSAPEDGTAWEYSLGCLQ